MAKSILDEKVGEFTLLDGGLIALSKISTEALLSKWIGNGTTKSGFIKTIGAVGLSMLSKNKYLQYVSSGLLIDGVEDIAYGLKNTAEKDVSGEVIM